MASCLEKFPSEIYGLIGGHLRIRDLNSVCRTCHTLNHGFLANLYRCVVIKVPIRWSRLVSLENLICSAGLKFTTSIRIIAQQQPSVDDIHGSEDGRTAQEIEDEKELLFCLPQISASKALNVMIRLLLLRMPNSHLNLFHWLHSCAVEPSTLALLLKSQGTTLRQLSITRYSEPQQVSSLLVGGLQQLAITDLNLEQSCEWPSKLITHNCHTLRNLHLGIVNTVARDYQTYNLSHWRRLPASFAEAAKGAIPASEQEMIPMLSLDQLGLYGLSLEEIAKGALGLKIDFYSMTALKLDSCHGLEDAFPLLMGKSASQSVLKLTSLFVRHKDWSQNFAQHLATFLTSFTGLKHLVLLLEGQSQAISKAPILELHGKTLQKLVWDERRGPRKDTKTDTSLYLKDNNLPLISLQCPNMIALGLPMRWVSLQANSFLPLERIARRMPKLRTFHCRNLPNADLTGSFLPMDYMVKSLASIFFEHARGKSSNPQNPLTTIAFGAPVYSDIHIGSNHFFRDSVRDYLQLRVYHVDYKYQSVLGPSPTLTQVAKGIADDAAICPDKDLLNEYWLV